MLQMYCQLQLFMTLLAGLLLKVNRSVVASATTAEKESTDAETKGIGSVLIVGNVSVLVAGLFAAILDAYDDVARRQRGVSRNAPLDTRLQIGNGKGAKIVPVVQSSESEVRAERRTTAGPNELFESLRV